MDKQELRKKSQDFAVRYLEALEDDDYELAEKLTLEHIDFIQSETKKAEGKYIVHEVHGRVGNTVSGQPLYWAKVRPAELQESEGDNLATEKLNEKHQELLGYLKTRQPFRATYRDIIKNTSLNSIGSVQFGLEKLESLGLIKRVARSSYRVVESEGEG